MRYSYANDLKYIHLLFSVECNLIRPPKTSGLHGLIGRMVLRMGWYLSE